MGEYSGMSAAPQKAHRMARIYYLSGPMSGIPQYNYQLFDRVAALLRRQGYAIVSPAEMDSPEMRAAALASPDGKSLAGVGGTCGDFLARDVRLIADQVQGIIMLPGWERSRGARLEAFVALLQPNCDFLRWDDQASQPVPVSRRTVQGEIHAAWGLA